MPKLLRLIFPCPDSRCLVEALQIYLNRQDYCRHMVGMEAAIFGKMNENIYALSP